MPTPRVAGQEGRSMTVERATHHQSKPTLLQIPACAPQRPRPQGRRHLAEPVTAAMRSRLAPLRGGPYHGRMNRRMVLAFLLAPAVIAGCGGTHASVSTVQRPPDGGLSGRQAVLYRYAYAHCLPFATESADSNPTGSNPPIYSMTHSYPLVMLGHVKPHNSAEWKAAKDGCALGIVTAVADANSSITPAVCQHMAPWLPAKLPDCPNVG
jgi:hypothetical protein